MMILKVIDNGAFYVPDTSGSAGENRIQELALNHLIPGACMPIHRHDDLLSLASMHGWVLHVTQAKEAKDTPFDLKEANEEGWTIDATTYGYLEIQNLGKDKFNFDHQAESRVMELAEASDYHLNALKYITQENLRRYDSMLPPLSDLRPLGLMFMWLRTWDANTINRTEIVKVRVDYDPKEEPDQPAVCVTVHSHQDLMSLEGDVNMVDVTFENSEITCCSMPVSIDVEDAGSPDSQIDCNCACGASFPISATYGHNTETVVSGGTRINVAKCPNCGALGYNPLPR